MVINMISINSLSCEAAKFFQYAQSIPYFHDKYQLNCFERGQCHTIQKIFKRCTACNADRDLKNTLPLGHSTRLCNQCASKFSDFHTKTARLPQSEYKAFWTDFFKQTSTIFNIYR